MGYNAMNFFENEMRTMFKDAEMLQDKKFCGKTMLAKLDDDLRLKLRFVAQQGDHYTGIEACIINRTDGAVDSQIFRFGDIIGMRKDYCGNTKHPYIWDYNGKPYWYFPVSRNEKLQIADTILDYVGMYQEPSMTQKM